MELSLVSTWSEFGFAFGSVVVLALGGLLLSSYVKIVTVLGMVRVGLGFQSLPSAFVTTGLALALSLLVMYPTMFKSTAAMDKVFKQSGSKSSSVQARALDKGLEEWRGFLVEQTQPEERERFHSISKNMYSDKNIDHEVSDTDWPVIAPAFIVSELKKAFATGLSIFLPFLIIDLLVANILAAVGYIQLSPMFVAFPFKLLLFVLVDGWSMITTNIISTYV